jgi:putative addiction module component (TIGR02574 family)
MPLTLDVMKSEACRLSSRERAELAHYLLSSLELEEDPDAEAEWDSELTRRAAEIENGSVVGIPATDVFARLREKYS